MEQEPNKLIQSPPAAYANTTATELKSIATIRSLIDTTFIKPDLRQVDKYPNTDGTLEITDIDQIPVGKIEVQIKTLSPADQTNPKHQFSSEFLSYCEQSLLPVVLIAVDNTNNKAYWRYIDNETIEEAAKNMKGDSYVMQIPVGNCIDGISNQYISSWIGFVVERRMKIWNYDFLNEQKDKLELQVNELKQYLEQPQNEESPFYREIHTFLDHYNHILDQEFLAVKKIIYFDFWKIGIGIISYSFNQVSFFLYPIEYTKNQLLIKVVKPGTNIDFITAMQNREMLVYASNNESNEIRTTPQKYAYSLLKREILGIIGKHNFEIDNIFLANEYLTSFIDRFFYAFGFVKGEVKYNIKTIKKYIYIVLPIIAESDVSFAGHVTFHWQDLESYSSNSIINAFPQKIADAEKKISANYKPKVRVTITSRDYDINLVNYFIDLLELNSIREVSREYRLEDPTVKMDPYHPGTWIREVIFDNLQIFFTNYLGIYDRLIDTKFPYLQAELGLFKKYNLVVYVFHYFDAEGKRHNKPYLEYYSLKSTHQFEPKIRLYDSADPACPVNGRKFFKDQNYICKVEDYDSEVVQIGGQPLDFMFTKSPTYSLINDILTKKMDEYFRQMDKLES